MITNLFNQNSELIGLIVVKMESSNWEQLLVAYMPSKGYWVTKGMLLNNELTLAEQYSHIKKYGIVLCYEQAIKGFSLDNEGLVYEPESAN